MINADATVCKYSKTFRTDIVKDYERVFSTLQGPRFLKSPPFRQSFSEPESNVINATVPKCFTFYHKELKMIWLAHK